MGMQPKHPACANECRWDVAGLLQRLDQQGLKAAVEVWLASLEGQELEQQQQQQQQQQQVHLQGGQGTPEQQQESLSWNAENNGLMKQGLPSLSRSLFDMAKRCACIAAACFTQSVLTFSVLINYIQPVTCEAVTLLDLLLLSFSQSHACMISFNCAVLMEKYILPASPRRALVASEFPVMLAGVRTWCRPCIATIVAFKFLVAYELEMPPPKLKKARAPVLEEGHLSTGVMVAHGFTFGGLIKGHCMLYQRSGFI
eukprot:1158635-Pelagomonas_calceolata.AAC.7